LETCIETWNPACPLPPHPVAVSTLEQAEPWQNLVVSKAGASGHTRRSFPRALHRSAASHPWTCRNAPLHKQRQLARSPGSGLLPYMSAFMLGTTPKRQLQSIILHFVRKHHTALGRLGSLTHSRSWPMAAGMLRLFITLSQPVLMPCLVSYRIMYALAVHVRPRLRNH